MPKHIFEGKKFDTFAFYDLGKGWPVGTGHFKLVEAQPLVAGQSIAAYNQILDSASRQAFRLAGRLE